MATPASWHNRMRILIIQCPSVCFESLEGVSLPWPTLTRPVTSLVCRSDPLGLAGTGRLEVAGQEQQGHSMEQRTASITSPSVGDLGAGCLPEGLAPEYLSPTLAIMRCRVSPNTSQTPPPAFLSAFLPSSFISSLFPSSACLPASLPVYLSACLSV